MPDVPLKAAPFGNIPPDRLARGFTAIGQPVTPTADGVLISRRAPAAGSWLQFHELAAAGFDPAAFTEAYVGIDSRVNPDVHLALEGRDEAREAVRRWLDRGDLGQMSHKFLETKTADERHLFLREIVLPVFFEKYPNGKLGCVTYDERANHYLAFLSTLKKTQALNSSDPAVIQKYMGRFEMSSFALNVPAELIWLMLAFSSIQFFPDAYAFFATCEHLYFLVFITDAPIDISRGEDRYPPVARLVPTLLSMLDAKDTPSALFVDDRFVPPTRSHPFSRRHYAADQIVAYVREYVLQIDGLLDWMYEATNFVAADGQFDLDFAWQVYLTIFLLINATFRIVIEQADMFTRKMAFFDVLELYAGLVDSGTGQTAAWKAHLQQPFVGTLRAALGSYSAPFGNDFTDALDDLLERNVKKIEAGLIYGTNADKTVSVPNKGNVPLDEYVVRLLRALRNTKHGFAIREEEYLTVHSGDISNDLPDYVLPLWLSFVRDRSSYTLKH